MHHPHRSRIGVACSGLFLALIGCGSRAAFSPPPINLSVSVNNTTIVVPPNGMPVNVPVTIVAPTETSNIHHQRLACGSFGELQGIGIQPFGITHLGGERYNRARHLHA